MLEKNNFKISEKLIEAYEFALKKHEGFFRNTGEPYIVHPIEVAKNLRKFKKSKEIDMLTICALLHDTLEDTNTTYYELVELFGYEVASIVHELTIDQDLKKEIGKTKYLAIEMKNMTNWALTLKLCDRLSNVSDLNICDIEFREKYSSETIDILEYLTQHRKLNNTQISITKAIINMLFPVINKNNFSKLSKLKKIIINLEKDNNYQSLIKLTPKT